MQASRINPAISTYEALNGPYDWNQYPLTLLGCKAVVYKDGNTGGSWALGGVDGWYLGSLMDHYRCDLYYIAKIWVYRISGFTELSPNTAKCQTWPQTNTFAHSPTSWPNQQQLQVQPIREDGSLSYSNQILKISFIPLHRQIHRKQNKGWEREKKGWLMKHPSSPFWGL